MNFSFTSLSELAEQLKLLKQRNLDLLSTQDQEILDHCIDSLLEKTEKKRGLVKREEIVSTAVMVVTKLIKVFLNDDLF